MNPVFSRTIPVVCSFDANFVVPAATFIHSLLSSVDDESFVDLHILLDERSFPNAEYNALDAIVAGKKNARLTYIDVRDYFLSIRIPPNYPKAIFHRLLIHRFLPNYEKALYFDVDIIVKKDIAGLFDIDLEGKYAAVIKELMQDGAYCRRLGIETVAYFNSGVMVLNLDKMRMDSCEKDFLDLAQSGSFWFPDQDILNIRFARSTLCASPLYNYIIPRYMDRYRNSPRLCPERLMLKNAAVIHFTSAKPWVDGSVPMAASWRKHYRACKKLLPDAIIDSFEAFRRERARAEQKDSRTMIDTVKRCMRYLRINELRDYVKYRIIE